MKKISIRCLFTIVVVLIYYPAGANARDLIANVGHLPPHAEMGPDGQPKGGFVEVVRAIDRVYTEGRIIIKVYPVARCVQKVVEGLADFFIPYIPNPEVPEASLPFSFVSEPVVDVSFVLYTQAGTPLLPLDRLYQYRIETLRGAAPHFPFKIFEIDSFEQGILKVIRGRSDGFIVEQDAADRFIRKSKIKNLRRTLYATWHSSILISKGPKGKEIDRILSNALHKLKTSGELQKITATIHRPYSEWQPYEMEW